MPPTKFQTLEEIATLISGFETGGLAHSEWNHRAHLTMAFWYLSRFDEAQATERIRSGILQYNQRQGTPNTDKSGYHETLTLFWIRVVGNFLKERRSGAGELEIANELIEAYSGKTGLWREYYSLDLVRSVESRRNWIEPDRKAL